MTARLFDIIKKELVSQIVHKPVPEQHELDALRPIGFFEGKSGSEILEVDSFLGLREIEGRTILKISPQQAWADFVPEDQRYDKSGALKALFAELVWRFEIHSPVNQTETYTCTFWKHAHDIQPLSEIKSLESLSIASEQYSALSLTARKLFKTYQLQVPRTQVSFTDVCVDILGYRIDAVAGNIYSFAHHHFKISSKKPTFRWSDIELPDPCFYSHNAHQIFMGRLYEGDIHGDLHAGNVFAVFQHNKAEDIYLIDAGLTSRQQVLFYDQAYLEVSQIINSQVTQEDEATWLQWFDWITEHLRMNSDDFVGTSEGNHLLKQIEAIREPFWDFLKQHSSLSKALEQQYRLQLICAALNFSNKPLLLYQRRFAFLLAAFWLKSFILKYDDDPEIYTLKQNLSKDPHFLYKKERQFSKQYEDIWQVWNQKRLKEIEPLNQLFSDYQKLQKLQPYQRIASNMTKSFADSFVEILPGSYLPLCETDVEKSSLLGLLALSIQNSLKNFSTYVFEKPTLLDIFQNIDCVSLPVSAQLDCLRFACVLLEDALIFDQEREFAYWSEKITTQIKSLDQRTDFLPFQNQLFYYQGLYAAMHFRLHELEQILQHWQPEKESRLNAEFLIKKAFLMSHCFSLDLNPALEVLSLGLRHLDLWPYQEQVYFLEAYQYLRRAIRFESQTSKEDGWLKEYKNHGFSGVFELYHDYYSPAILKEESPPSNKGYSIIYRDIDPEDIKKNKSIQLIHLLLRTGFPAYVRSNNLISQDTWSKICCLTVKQFYRLSFYYSFAYIYQYRIDAQGLRELICKYFLSSQYQDFYHEVFAELKAVYQQIYLQDSRINVLLIAVLSEFLSKIPYSEWRELFSQVWFHFHQPEHRKALYSMPEQGPLLLIQAALPRLEDPDLLRDCLIELLETGDDFDADVFIRPKLISAVSDNPRFAALTCNEFLNQRIQTLIEESADFDKANYTLWLLHRLNAFLKPDNLDAIAQNITNLTRLPGFTNSLRLLVYFTQNYPRARVHLHELILAEGSRVWDHGIRKNEKGNWERAFLGDGALPLHELKYKATFTQGLMFKPHEIQMLYAFLKNSIMEFKQSPFVPVTQKLASKQVFLSGLNFSLLKEILAFLSDYATVLQADSKYQTLKEEIMDGIQEHAPSSGRAQDLIDTNHPNTVLEGISNLRNLLLERNFDALPEYWFILLSKVLTQQEPHLRPSLELMSYWLVYYRDEDVLQQTAYINTYLQILERYYAQYPENEEPASFECSLVKLAMVLDFWGQKSKAITHFMDLHTQSQYEAVRLLKDLKAQDVYNPISNALDQGSKQVLEQIDQSLLTLSQVDIQGFKSFAQDKRVAIDLKPLNVLIGANGAGKSNFLSLFQLVQYFSKQPLNSIVSMTANPGDYLFYGAKQSSEFSAALTFCDENWQIIYDFVCKPNHSHTGIYFSKEQVKLVGQNTEKILLEDQAAHTDSILLTRQDNYFVSLLNQLLADIQEFHIRDTSFESQNRHGVDLNQHKLLANASNLAAVLYALKNSENNRKYYLKITRFIKSIFPQFQDFVFEPDFERSKIYLNWREQGSDHLFSAHQASDGTLRFMALATILNQPVDYMPKILILDEPELGLHPKALAVLAAMLDLATQHSRIILTTQSGDFLDQFEADDIIVVERLQTHEQDKGSLFASSMKRKNTEALAEWLEEYSLSELWHKNILGGKP